MSRNFKYLFAAILLGLFSLNAGLAQQEEQPRQPTQSRLTSEEDGHSHSHVDDDHSSHDHGYGDGHTHDNDGHGHGELSACSHHESEFDLANNAITHIADANEFHIWGDISMPLPVFLYSPEAGGWKTGLSSMFDHGHTAVDGYVLNHGRVNKVADPNFPMGEVHLESEHVLVKSVDIGDGKTKDYGFICYQGNEYRLDPPSTLDGGLVGGGITSFYDFSITKNVFTMILAAVLLILLWLSIASRYKRRDGLAPTGIQSFFEPFFVFIRDEVSIPMIGEKKYERFQPFIMTLFFFILFCNLMGLIPFFPGSANVTGNIAVTLVLAVLAFLVTNLNGNKHYWEHVFWMPGIPWWVKFIITPVEILGLFIKPFSLMIRLFANISAGHIIILSLIGLIFFFGDSGESLGGGVIGVIVGGFFTAFMNLIELLVAFLQAFIFAILTASYIGAAVEEHHHDHEEASHEHQGAGMTIKTQEATA
ncbi:MAG: F0F1 ATP synthase subunit A [Bacteroidota bacterium]